jgi:hypothetical protein
MTTPRPIQPTSREPDQSVGANDGAHTAPAKAPMTAGGLEAARGELGGCVEARGSMTGSCSVNPGLWPGTRGRCERARMGIDAHGPRGNRGPGCTA